MGAAPSARTVFSRDEFVMIQRLFFLATSSPHSPIDLTVRISQRCALAALCVVLCVFIFHGVSGLVSRKYWIKTPLSQTSAGGCSSSGLSKDVRDNHISFFWRGSVVRWEVGTRLTVFFVSSPPVCLTWEPVDV